MYTEQIYSNSLCHHGIKGQKWGVRRYQNEDGTLTPEGREKYRKNISRINDLGKASRDHRKEADRYERDAKNAYDNYVDVKKNGYKSEAAREFVASGLDISVKDLYKEYSRNKQAIDEMVEFCKDIYAEDFREAASYAGAHRMIANDIDKDIKAMSKDLTGDYKTDNDVYVDMDKALEYYTKIRSK